MERDQGVVRCTGFERARMVNPNFQWLDTAERSTHLASALVNRSTRWKRTERVHRRLSFGEAKSLLSDAELSTVLEVDTVEEAHRSARSTRFRGKTKVFGWYRVESH